MATTREIVNKVLRGLRQFGLIIPSGTNTITDDYLLMILQFVNESKEEIEEAGWPWQALRTTVTITLASMIIEYDLTIAGAADVDTNDRSQLLYENVNQFGRSERFYNGMSALPQVWDVTTSSENRLREITQERMERFHFTDNDDTGKPVYFSVYSDGDSIRMKIWPTPDQTYTLKSRFYIPQTELLDTDTTTSLSIPQRPVWMKALLKANAERGDELGSPTSTLGIAYLDAHGAATGKEQTPADTTVGLER